MKFLDYSGLQHLITEIKTRYVQKTSGKDLSTNDFTNVLKQKLDGIETNANRYVHPEKHGVDIINETVEKQFISEAQKDKLNAIESGAQSNKIELIKRNGSNLTITNKSVDIAVPTKLSDLTNDKTYKTEAEIRTLIQEVGRLKKEIVTTLPAVGSADSNTMYLIASGSGYAEYLLINGNFEKLGDTSDIDLTGYVKTTDITVISDAEINAFLNA